MEIPTTRYARSGPVNIAYQVIGEGPIGLVMIPGWVSNLEENWNQPELAGWLRQLASFSRLILFDKRGTGLSDPVPEQNLPSLAVRMEDLQAVLEAAGCKKAALLGLSEGGPMAVRFAASYPEVVSHLLLYGSFSRWIPTDDYPWGLTLEQHLFAMEAFRQQWGTPIGFKLMAPSRADDEAAKARWAAYLRRGASPGTAAALYRMNMEIDVRELLAKVSAPTLIMHREGDGLIEVGHSRYMHSRIPNAQYIEWAGDDHLPWFGDAASVIAAIASFLLGEHTVAGAQAGSLDTESLIALHQARQYLEEHYQEPITLGSLARQAGTNEFKLKQGFKKLFGAPVIATLTRIRLEKAASLLCESKQSVEEIAQEVGYQHPNNLTAAFKRHFGMTPTAWRKKAGD